MQAPRQTAGIVSSGPAVRGLPMDPGALSGFGTGPVRLPAMARAAARAPLLKKVRGVEYLDLPCRSALNRCTSEQMPFRWTINPYRGCEFACRYCYARYTHEFLGLEGGRLFETRIFARTNIHEAFESDLPPGRDPEGSIAIGTVTDPYQPAERSLRVTRRLLEGIARRRGLRLSLTTKGALVTRDLDLLREVSGRNALTVHITITTLSRRLSRMLEPRAPRPASRLEAVKALASGGIDTGVFIMPVLPGITDAPQSLEAIVSAAARAGASHVAHQTLFLRSSARKVLLPFLADRFPKLSPRYRRKYGASACYPADYRRRLNELMEALKRQHGFGEPTRREDSRWQGERAESETVRPAGRRTETQLALAF